MRRKRADQAVDLAAARSLVRATDDQLLVLVSEGNSRAFEAIVERYRPALARFCGSLTSPERVDDAVQQTFVSAWLAIDRGVLVRDLRPWLYRIARNAAIDQHRAARGIIGSELSDDLVGGTDPAHLSAGRTYFEDVLRAVADLPERQRVALLETAVHGRSTDAVADDLGVSGGALRQLVHRARTTVRMTVPSLGAGPLTNWLAQVGADDSGLRRLATVLGGAGSGTVAALSKTTAAVVSVGAIAAGGIAATGDHEAATKTRTTASAGGTARAGGSAGSSATGGAGSTSGAAGAVAASTTAGARGVASRASTGAASTGAAGAGSVVYTQTISLSTTTGASAPSRARKADGDRSDDRSSDTSSPGRNHGSSSDGDGATARSHAGSGPSTSSGNAAGPSDRSDSPVARPVQSSLATPRANAGGRNCDHGGQTSAAPPSAPPSANSGSSAQAEPTAAAATPSAAQASTVPEPSTSTAAPATTNAPPTTAVAQPSAPSADATAAAPPAQQS